MTDEERAALIAAAHRAVWGKPLNEMTAAEVREHNRVLSAALELELEAARGQAAMVAALPLAKVLEFKPTSRKKPPLTKPSP